MAAARFDRRAAAVGHRHVAHARVLRAGHALFHAIWPEGPTAEGAALLRLDPRRLHVADAMTVATPRVWKPVTAYR